MEKTKKIKNDEGFNVDGCSLVMNDTADHGSRNIPHASVSDIHEVCSVHDNFPGTKLLLHSGSRSSNIIRNNGEDVDGDAFNASKKKKENEENKISLPLKIKSTKGKKKKKNDDDEKFTSDRCSLLRSDTNNPKDSDLNVQKVICPTGCDSTSKEHDDNMSLTDPLSLERKETLSVKLKRKKKKKTSDECTANESPSLVTNMDNSLSDHAELCSKLKEKKKSEKATGNEFPLQSDPENRLNKLAEVIEMGMQHKKKTCEKLTIEMEKQQRKRTCDKSTDIPETTCKPEKDAEADVQDPKNIGSIEELSTDNKSTWTTQTEKCETTKRLHKHTRRAKKEKPASHNDTLGGHDTQISTYKTLRKSSIDKEECSHTLDQYNENYLSSSIQNEKINHPITNGKKHTSTRKKEKVIALPDFKEVSSGSHSMLNKECTSERTMTSDCKEKLDCFASSKQIYSPHVEDVDSSLDMDRIESSAANKMITPLEQPVATMKKKLVVLDLNGLLADVTFASQNTDQAHRLIGGKSVFKRPFCDEFLKFCFEAFDIGVWSSRRGYNVDAVVDFLMGKMKHNLLFCWDQSMCTDTGFKTVENSHKPLVLKKLKKLWNKRERGLCWENGKYSPSNTLLIDDSPYKAICNPPHTGIFPSPYSHLDEDDNSLGSGGDLRVYLEGLAMADDVQLYVQKNPFGQPSITDSDPYWPFYFKLIEKFKDS